MTTQQSNAHSPQEPESTLASEPSSRHLGIWFFPVVAFAVCCKPAETNRTGKHREGSRTPVKEICRLAASVRHRTLVVSGHARAPGQS